MTCAVGSAAQGTTRSVFGSALQHDVDLGWADRAVVVRVFARDGLQEDALRHPHALVLGELGRRHDLAARDARHVGHDGLDFGDAVLLEELLDRRITHDRFPWARSRAASPKAANSACENGLLMTCHSGCHCTATAKPRASRTRKASTRPSGARASTSRRAAELLHALRVHRVHLDAIRSGQPVQHAAGDELDFVRRSVLHLERDPPCSRDDRASPGTSWTFCQSVPPKATFISWKPRQTREHRHAACHGQRDRAAGSVASRCESCSVPESLAGPA